MPTLFNLLLAYLTGKASSSPFFFSSQSPATALAPLSSAVNVGIGLGLFVPLPQSVPQISQNVPSQLLLHFDCPMPRTVHDKIRLLLQ